MGILKGLRRALGGKKSKNDTTASADHLQDPLTDVLTEDMVSKRKGGPGTKSINEVHHLKYKQAINKQGAKEGYFKASEGNEVADAGMAAGIDGRMSGRAVASSRLDQALGTNVLSEDRFAMYDGEVGTVSAKARGTELISTLYEDRLGNSKSRKADKRLYAQMKEEGSAGRLSFDHKGRIAKDSGSRFNYTDTTNAKFQKGMSDLQVMDYLTGQVDRHSGNIFVDDDGTVTGIDNDQAFGTNNDNIQSMASHAVGLPQQIDKATGKAILEMSEQDFLKTIGGKDGDPESLTAEEKSAALERFRTLYFHVLEMDLSDELVGEWNEDTFQAAMDSESGSYTKRLGKGLENARWFDEVKGQNDDKGSVKARHERWESGADLKRDDFFGGYQQWYRDNIKNA